MKKLEVLMHYFHFSLDVKTIKALKSYNKEKTLSKILKKMVEDFFRRARTERSFGKRQKREYKLIHPSKKIEREDVWFSITDQNFRQIRRIRWRFNFLSLAQVIRAMIDLLLGRDADKSVNPKKEKVFFLTSHSFFQLMQKKEKRMIKDLNKYLLI